MAPLIIEFVAPSMLHVQEDRPSQLPIHRNGPPGTFVLLSHGLQVSLPTDQIVSASDDGGWVRVGFGGMAFEGETQGRLVFQRVRELKPEDQLSPARSHTMFLEPAWVRAVYVNGQQLWPRRVN